MVPASSFATARRSLRVAPRFTMTTGSFRRVAWSTSRTPEFTVSDEPTTSSASASATIETASRNFSAGTNSPKNTTSGFSTPPHTEQSGTRKRSTSVISTSPSGCSCTVPGSSIQGFSRSSTPARSARENTCPHVRQTARSIEPWISTTRRDPARRCRPSTFCVTTPVTMPASSRAASAR